VDSALKVIQVDSEETAVVLPAKGQAGGETEAASQSDIPDALLGEIQIMEALRGAPNIVAIEDFSFKRDGSTCSLFVRMELLTSLQKVLPGRNGQSTLSSIQEIIKLGRDVCRALVYCEKIDIIHRDIKPANLFVDRFGDYKVGDFGASRRMDTVHIAETMTGVGTISYMAPEIFRGRSYNNTVDIYSLGLVLYQLLNNGRMPFLPEGDSYTTQDIDSANYRRLHGTPVPTLVGRSVGGEMIDSRLDAVVRRACAMDPADRYQSAKEFYDALALTETEEKKPVPVYAKRPQGSLAPDASLQNQEQERARQEPGIKPPGDLEPAVPMQDRQQERGQSGLEVRPSAAPPPERSSYSRPQKAERRSGRNNIPVMVIVFLLIIAVAALVIVQGRGGSLAGSDTDTASEDDGRAPGPISDSWEEIIAAGEDGTYVDKYKIGDTKELDLGEEGVIEMELVAFDADELADGSGKAHMTWIAKNLLNTEHVMNEEYTNEGGWPASDMRAWLQKSILPLFPKAVRSNISEVKKYSYSYSDQGTISSVDTIWIPSRREILGANNALEDKGTEYLTAFPDDASRQKRHISGSNYAERAWWWLRSTHCDFHYSFYSVYFDGSSEAPDTDDHSAYDDGGVVVGFCF
jgi:serine/threonine protein kinase